jgi:ornithine--oxo-acid transaminase
MPPAGYLAAAEQLCRRYGTLFVLDEVQTGLCRTGPFLAAQHSGVAPDMVVLAKALSGGLVPCAAVLMTEAVYSTVFSSLRRAIIHTSTFGENALAMRAALATLDVLADERLADRATVAGEVLREKLRGRLAGHDSVREVRGIGLLNAVEFGPPRGLRQRLAYETLAAIHPAAFGQILVMRLLRDHGVLAQVCGNNFNVLKVAPPLTVTEAQIDTFVAALGAVVEDMQHSGGFWTDAVGIARRAVARI